MSNYYSTNPMAQPEKNNYAVFSLVIGILSLCFGCCVAAIFPCCIPIAFILAAVGLVLGILGLKSEKRTLAIIGIILSALAIMLPILLFIIGLIFNIGGGILGSGLEAFKEYIPQEIFEQLEEFQFYNP